MYFPSKKVLMSAEIQLWFKIDKFHTTVAINNLVNILYRRHFKILSTKLQ